MLLRVFFYFFYFVFLCPLSMTTGQCSFLLQSLGALTSRMTALRSATAHSLAVGDIRVFCL